MARKVLPGLPAFALILVAHAAAQSELVIVKDGTREYHRPACPAVRDARDVVAMTRAQAESRGFKPDPACAPDAPTPPPEFAPRAKPPSRAVPAAEPVFVYVSPGDNRYHRETCAKLGAEHSKVSLEDAVKKHWPCAVCRPPIRKRPNPPAVPDRWRRD